MGTTENAPASPLEIPPSLQMLQLLTGFQISQALYVVAKLDVATILSNGPRTIDQLAAETSASADALGRIIRFLATLGVFRTDGDQIEVTELGATLGEDHPDSFKYGALYWMETHYGPFGDFLTTARTGESAATRHFGQPFFDWISSDPERAELQNRAFANAATGLRSGLFREYNLPDGAVVADIGGADGSMLSQLLMDAPDRRGIVFDRPEIVAGAQKTLAEHGLTDRVQGVGGDFFESVPTADVYTLSYILHDWDDESCRRILRSIADAAEPGARVVLIEAVIPPGDEPHPAKVIDLTMLAITTGRERTTEEFQALLDSAGFTLDRIVPSPTPVVSFIEATLR
ncbi:methyltransferase [Actinoallomurus acaciae]|uniref:Methyltransferase n=1 Tax=Actinoallomurus acaciae TaxID=502577 RepID=A0ABV5Y9I8_9ACTN